MAGKADEFGHHTPPGLSHSNSPWAGRKYQDDATGGQDTEDVANKRDAQRGIFGCTWLSYGRGLGRVGEGLGLQRWRRRGREKEREMDVHRRDRAAEKEMDTERKQSETQRNRQMQIETKAVPDGYKDPEMLSC